MLRVGAFRVDLESERLWHGADPIALRPKTWAVLRLLLARPGKLVTKQELLDTVWEGTAVEEKTLNASIAEIRHAFGDSARAPRVVETVHRRGFRLIAALGGAEAGAPAVPGAASRSRPFLGREPELRRLLAAADRLRAGGGGVVPISGPAGIGKSRLVEELLAAARDATVLVARCSEGGSVPYWPWVELIRSHMRSSAPEAPGEHVASELGRIVPALDAPDAAAGAPLERDRHVRAPRAPPARRAGRRAARPRPPRLPRRARAPRRARDRARGARRRARAPAARLGERGCALPERRAARRGRAAAAPRAAARARRGRGRGRGRRGSRARSARPRPSPAPRSASGPSRRTSPRRPSTPAS
jgi:DNA-binding winged helix-turn-helix (wHTH) protein